MESYTQSQLLDIYELGRLYFEMGYYYSAEKIFAGLTAVDEGHTPAAIGWGLIKLERGQFEEAAGLLRQVGQASDFKNQGRLGLALTFIGQGEIERARILLSQIEQELNRAPEIHTDLLKVNTALLARCGQGR